MMSPSGIIAAGAAAAATIAIGLPVVAVVGATGAAWAIRVGLAIPRKAHSEEPDAFALAEPWRRFVLDAQQATRQFDRAIKDVKDGPLREWLVDMSNRIRRGSEECWRIARAGNELAIARSRIDVATITYRLSEINSLPESTRSADSSRTPDTTGTATSTDDLPGVQSTRAQTIEALEAQLQSAKRLDTTITDTADRLRLLNARFGEALTRAIELSVRSHSSDGLDFTDSLDKDVDDLVDEMESLRQALNETG